MIWMDVGRAFQRWPRHEVFLLVLLPSPDTGIFCQVHLLVCYSLLTSESSFLDLPVWTKEECLHRKPPLKGCIGVGKGPSPVDWASTGFTSTPTWRQPLLVDCPDCHERPGVRRIFARQTDRQEKDALGKLMYSSLKHVRWPTSWLFLPLWDNVTVSFPSLKQRIDGLLPNVGNSCCGCEIWEVGEWVPAMGTNQPSFLSQDYSIPK